MTLKENGAGPRFSVIITNHNYADYLAEAVASARAQTCAPAEIIVVDDGSTDHSAKVLDHLMAEDPALRVVRKDNGGQLSAFIAGAAEARGDVFAFLDADDQWMPDYLAAVATVYREHPTVDFVYTPMCFFGSREGQFKPLAADIDHGLSVLLGAFEHPWQGSATSAVSLARPLALRVLDLPPSMAAEWRTRADDCLVFGADILGGHKYGLARPLVRYRAHGRNTWLDQPPEPINDLRYRLRSERMLEFYRQQAGVTPQLLRFAKHEFRTKPKPTGHDYRAYARLLGRAPLSWPKRLEHRLGLLRHLFAHRRG